MDKKNKISLRTDQTNSLINSEDINSESYLMTDILKNYHVDLSELEFNLLRIHRFLYIYLKGHFTSNTTYIIPGNKYLSKLYETKKISFQTSYFKNHITFNGVPYTIKKKGRCITFHYKESSSVRFIPNVYYLKDVLNNYKITSFYVSNNENSNISIDDANSVFEDEEIVELFDKSKKKVLSEENFTKRFNNNLITIKDISFNSKEYFKESCDNEFFYDIYDEAYEKIFQFFDSNQKILYLFGPRKSGKSVFLNFLPYSLSEEKYASLYLNISSLKRTKNKKDIKNLLYHELLYTIIERDEVEKLYNSKLFKDIQYNKEPLYYIYSFIKKLLEKYKDNIFSAKLIVIIIDNLNIFDNPFKYDTLNNILEIINKEDKFKIIISGEGTLFIEKIKIFYTHKEEINEQYLFMNKVNNQVITIKSNKPKEDIINEELNYLNQFNIINLIYCNNLDGKIINFIQFKALNIIKILPNYLTIDFSDDRNEIKFEITNKIFKEALNKKIAYYIQKSQLKSIMSREYFPRNVYGISEELLIILLLKYNKFKINSLFFKEENLIEVEEINKLKNIYSLDKFKGKINEEDNYLICQKNYNGENYDILIIQSLKKSKIAIFCQIGVDKKETDILKQLKDLKENSQNYLKYLYNYFGFKVDYISLLYIFDEDTQKELKSPNEKSGSKYCIKYKVDFLVYSFADNALKKYDIQNGDYYSINGNNYYLNYQI